MVLDHVAQRAGALVVRGTTLDADSLGGGNLNVVDVPPIPDRLVHAVAESEDQQVLYGLLPQIVIDPEDLLFVEVLVHDRVEGARAGRDRCRTASR